MLPLCALVFGELLKPPLLALAFQAVDSIAEVSHLKLIVEYMERYREKFGLLRILGLEKGFDLPKLINRSLRS